MSFLSFFTKFLFRNKSKQKIIISKLKSLDYKSGKTFAYNFTALARELELTEREKRLFDDIFDDLKQYKYRSNSSALTNSSIAKIEVFLGSVD